MDKFRIHAELVVEKDRVHPGEYGSDPRTDYVVVSTSMYCEGALTFTCRPSQLESTLRTIFKTMDPMMKKTAGLVPDAHSSMNVTKAVPTTADGKSIKRHFLTRDPIYKAPEGSTKELVLSISRDLLGRDPGAGLDLFGDLLDDMVTPRRREPPRGRNDATDSQLRDRDNRQSRTW